MDSSLLCVPQFLFIIIIFFLLLIYFYQTFCCCCLVLLLFYFLSKIFSFLTGLSSLLEPSGFWHLALPLGVCSLECNNNNDDLVSNTCRGKASLLVLLDCTLLLIQ